MGIRIHTVLGWGFKYCKYADDPRMNPAVFNGNISEEDILPRMLELNARLIAENKGNNTWVDDFSAQLFDDYVHAKGWAKDKQKIKSFSVHDFLCFSGFAGEYTRSGAMVITCPTQSDWNRYDDIIDYYLAPSTEQGPMDSVKLIVDGAGQPAQVYPGALFVNRKTGKSLSTNSKLKYGITQSDRWSITNMFFSTPKKDRKKWKWKSLGVKNIVEWQRDVVPLPPYEIRLFCEAVNLFKNPLTVYRLKPMVSIYWC